MDHLRTGAIFRPSNSEFLKSPVPRLTNIRGVGSAFVGPDSRTTAPPLSSPEDSGTEGQRFVNSSVADRGSPVGRDQVIARPIPSRLFPTPPPRRQRDPSSSSVSSTFSHTLRTQQHASDAASSFESLYRASPLPRILQSHLQCQSSKTVSSTPRTLAAINRLQNPKEVLHSKEREASSRLLPFPSAASTDRIATTDEVVLDVVANDNNTSERPQEAKSSGVHAVVDGVSISSIEEETTNDAEDEKQDGRNAMAGTDGTSCAEIDVTSREDTKDRCQEHGDQEKLSEEQPPRRSRRRQTPPEKGDKVHKAKMQPKEKESIEPNLASDKEEDGQMEEDNKVDSTVSESDKKCETSVTTVASQPQGASSTTLRNARGLKLRNKKARGSSSSSPSLLPPVRKDMRLPVDSSSKCAEDDCKIASLTSDHSRGGHGKDGDERSSAVQDLPPGRSKQNIITAQTFEPSAGRHSDATGYREEAQKSVSLPEKKVDRVEQDGKNPRVAKVNAVAKMRASHPSKKGDATRNGEAEQYSQKRKRTDREVCETIAMNQPNKRLSRETNKDLRSSSSKTIAFQKKKKELKPSVKRRQLMPTRSRSGRNCLPPLRWWCNEAPKYTEDKTIIGVRHTLHDPLPVPAVVREQMRLQDEIDSDEQKERLTKRIRIEKEPTSSKQEGTGKPLSEDSCPPSTPSTRTDTGIGTIKRSHQKKSRKEAGKSAMSSNNRKANANTDEETFDEEMYAFSD